MSWLAALFAAVLQNPAVQSAARRLLLALLSALVAALGLSAVGVPLPLPSGL